MATIPDLTPNDGFGTVPRAPMVMIAENIHPALVNNRGLHKLALSLNLVKKNLPSSSPINKVQTSKRRAKIDDSIDNSHGKRINSSNVADKNGSVCRSKCLTGCLLEKVHGDNDGCSFKVLSLE